MAAPAPALRPTRPHAAGPDTAGLPAPQVNDVPIARPGEFVEAADLRQRACTELLRQAAIRSGYLSADDPAPVDGAISEAAAEAVIALLDEMLAVPVPEEAALRRHHAAHPARYAVGERVRARHVLFAVTPGVDIAALRTRAEAALLELRAAATAPAGSADRFATRAAEWSNCPTGPHGGALGWLSAEDCAPEFAREVFGQPEVGVLPRLVHSRFGLHVVEVLAREPGTVPPFEAVKDRVADALQRQAWTTALNQYLMLLAGNARLVGVDLDAADTPLVQ